MNEGHLRTFGPERTSRRRPAGSQRRLVRPAEPSRDGVRTQPALGPRASGLGPTAAATEPSFHSSQVSPCWSALRGAA